MPKNRRPLRPPPPLRVRLLRSLRRVLPARLQRPARLAHQAHLALLLPPRPRPARLPPPRLAQRRLPVVATRKSNRARDAASCVSLLASAIPERNISATGITLVSSSLTKLLDATASGRGVHVLVSKVTLLRDGSMDKISFFSSLRPL